jgi:hypothetical protein
MRVTGNGRLVELAEEEAPAFEASESWLRIAEPNQSKGTLAVYAWCIKGDPVYPTCEQPQQASIR